MPELPEVEVVRLGLAPAVTGATVTGVDVVDGRSLRRHPGPPSDFVGRLDGARLQAPHRRGKFLWIPLADRDEALLAHLGMSGQLLLRDSAASPARHTRVRIAIAHPDHGPLRVDFDDQRRFGSLALDRLVPVPTRPAAPGETIPTQVAHIARDPLDPHFDAAAAVAALRSRRSAVKRVLLDQHLISGIGNIYADEALWAARVHGERPAQGLSAREAHRVLEEVRAVFARALAEGGTSFDAQYLNVNGQAGYFQRSLAVYGREAEPCSRCGAQIRRAPFMNRSSFFCAVCQRPPRRLSTARAS